MSSVESIPIYAARLPQAEALLPYLREIDANARYTNRGPLLERLETRMAAQLGLPAGTVTVAANGTLALQAAILAAAGRAKPGRWKALVPGYTFVATAHAAQSCGYHVSFVDVSIETWSLDPMSLRERPASLDGVGLVIPVAPYGMAFDHASWIAFRNATNIPVVIDAAASFETIARQPRCVTAEFPVTISLHATKAFTTAEGGAVLWRDAEGMQRTIEALGFGFGGAEEREVIGPGLNGRLSEYNAAIGLASLDAADAQATERTNRCEAYRATAMRYGIVNSGLRTWPATASNYALFETSSFENAERLIRSFAAAEIAARRWYGRGLHREAFFARDHEGALPNTESLGDRMLGIPTYPGMQLRDVERVMDVLRTVQPATTAQQ